MSSPNSFCALFWLGICQKDFGGSKTFSVSLTPFCCCISWDCVRIREGVSKSVRRGNKVFFLVPLIGWSCFVLFVFSWWWFLNIYMYIYISISIHFLVPLFVWDFHDVKHVPLLVLKYLVIVKCSQTHPHRIETGNLSGRFWAHPNTMTIHRWWLQTAGKVISSNMGWSAWNDPQKWLMVHIGETVKNCKERPWKLAFTLLEKW